MINLREDYADLLLLERSDNPESGKPEHVVLAYRH